LNNINISYFPKRKDLPRKLDQKVLKTLLEKDNLRIKEILQIFGTIQLFYHKTFPYNSVDTTFFERITPFSLLTRTQTHYHSQHTHARTHTHTNAHTRTHTHRVRWKLSNGVWTRHLQLDGLCYPRWRQKLREWVNAEKERWRRRAKGVIEPRCLENWAKQLRSKLCGSCTLRTKKRTVFWKEDLNSELCSSSVSRKWF